MPLWYVNLACIPMCLGVAVILANQRQRFTRRWSGAMGILVGANIAAALLNALIVVAHFL
jgi:hypothetical protein